MFFERPDAGRRAVLLHVDFKDAADVVLDSAAECAELAATAGIEVLSRVGGRRAAPHPRWFVGSGKLEEVAACCADHDADLLLVNHELSPGQQRNLERRLGCRVLTRTELILQIFAQRARTYEGQLQVELAQLEHAQTRLVRGWTHLDRQKGGIGLRGAGETQLEMDQRMLAERIKAVRARLVAVARRRSQGRRRRQRGDARTLSLVGYTNAGKSTLFNALTSAGVEARDQLFATLDPTLRRLQVPGAGDTVLSDTVGFISGLPHALVDAFRATLEEVVNADLLLHVVDVAAPDADARIREVEAVLAEIGADDVPVVLVLNKIDQVPQAERDALSAPGRLGVAAEVPRVTVSARSGAGLDRLIEVIGERLGVREPTEVLLDPAQGKTRAWLYRIGAVVSEQTREDGSLALTLRADAALLSRLQQRQGGIVGAGGGFVAPPQGRP